MKLRTLIESKQSLENLLKGSLPINVAWELKKFVKLANPELSSFEELRNQKIIELGYEKEVDGNTVSEVKKENLPVFRKDIEELMDKDIDIIPPQIKISDLIGYKNIDGKEINISTADLMLLDWLIIE
jgi:hypothetical protein